MHDPVKIESLGVYLPETAVSMEQMLSSCRRRPRWDLERITGIREVRQAVGEYALDLAIKAAERALAMSAYDASELDVIICTGISIATIIVKHLGKTSTQITKIRNNCSWVILSISVN